MSNFIKDEKCAMIMGLATIGAIDDNRKYDRTKIMMRYQDMLGVDTFDFLEYSNTNSANFIPTLQAMSLEKKKIYVKMMLALMIEDGQIVDSEKVAFENLVIAAQIPFDIVKEALEEVR